MRLTPLARWGKAQTDAAHLSRWLRTPRTDQTAADYAYAGTRYEHERSYRWADAFAADVFAGVLIALSLGVL